MSDSSTKKILEPADSEVRVTHDFHNQNKDLWLTTSDVAACLPVLRVVAVAVLISLVWKWRVFVLAVSVYRSLPLQDHFFPTLLQSTWLLVAAYLGTIASVLSLILLRRRSLLMITSSSACACLALMCIHQQSYNDVTFLTCFWTCVWSWWFVRQLGQPAEVLLKRAAFLAHAILSVIFLGGTVGKLTPGYWSGEVLYNIYFEGRDYWLFNLMRQNLSNEYLELIARWYSRAIICVESICACLWLMPQRMASFLVVFVLCNIALMSNTQLFSVLTCLMGLALVGLHQPKPSSP